MIRVFTLDDQEVVRRGLRDLLDREDDIEVVGESASAVEALRRIPAIRPDLLVLDADLPDGSGVDVCRRVIHDNPAIRALILTSNQDDELLFSAIMAGASGYVLKRILGRDLVDAVRTVAAGRSLLDPAVTDRVLHRIRTGEEPPGELAALTEREQDILELVAEGLTNRQIAERTYLAEKTVKNYVSSLLSKLGLRRRTEAAVLATRLRRPGTERPRTERPRTERSGTERSGTDRSEMAGSAVKRTGAVRGSRLAGSGSGRTRVAGSGTGGSRHG